MTKVLLIVRCSAHGYSYLGLGNILLHKTERERISLSGLGSGLALNPLGFDSRCGGESIIVVRYIFTSFKRIYSDFLQPQICFLHFNFILPNLPFITTIHHVFHNIVPTSRRNPPLQSRWSPRNQSASHAHPRCTRPPHPSQIHCPQSYRLLPA